MKLIHNWKAIALHSHSMRAAYLGLTCLNMPDILFLSLGYDVASPVLWSALGNILLVYAIGGRLIDQGLSK